MNISDLEAFASFDVDTCSLADKIVLVTGAGDGIGKTAALTFARHGATVILLGRTVAKLEAVYDQIVEQGFAAPAIYPLCLEGASESDYQAIHDNIQSEFGRLDGLLHNAGLLGPRTPISNYQGDAWEKILKVNVTAEFMMTKALLPLLEQSSQGSILFTTSSVGRKGRAFWGAYSVSKFAVEALSQVLADELDGTSNIRVNCINPGATQTAMRAAAYPAEDPATVKTADSLMPAYLFLMSEASIGLSGLSLNV